MAYTLMVCSGRDTIEFPNPSPELIEQALDNLLPLPDNFLILETDISTNNCRYIQTLITDEGGTQLRYLVEARFEVDNDFQHYRSYTSDILKLKEMIRMFVFGKAPNICGWDDVTQEIKEVIA